MILWRSLSEPELPNELRFQPPTVFHLFCRESGSPSAAYGFQQIGELTVSGLG
jgi:hypothetical protein